ncbi:hypothetical protein J6590_012248 [Homalodisca vitripennis]|nr:hypothetical protein J6590_012248 [Homalodisca vitripennis]
MWAVLNDRGTERRTLSPYRYTAAASDDRPHWQDSVRVISSGIVRLIWRAAPSRMVSAVEPLQSAISNPEASLSSPSAVSPPPPQAPPPTPPHVLYPVAAHKQCC